jgi:hypothetical protein
MNNRNDSLSIIIFLLLLVVQYAVIPTGTATANDDVIVDFGSAGTWVLYDNADWGKLHSGTPEDVVTGDLDGNGQGEAIIDFGNSGIWVRTNNESWSKLHSMNPSIMAVGDFDGNLKDDIVINFGSGTGIWIYLNNTSWEKLHSLSTETIATGDIDGNGQDDIIVDFGSGTGIWLYLNNTSWEKLHRASPEIITTGNMDGNLKEDVIMDFGAAGIWVWKNNRSWVKLHSLSAEIIKTGDLDINGKDDVIFDFGFGLGIWARMNDTDWKKIHPLTPELIEVGDVDGDGKDDLIVDFGSLHGMWARYKGGKWKQLHKVSPEIMACGDMSGSNYITYTLSGTASIPGVDSPGRLWLVVSGDDNIYGMGASDTGGNFSIQASVPTNTERVFIIAVMPDNPEFFNRGYVELDDAAFTTSNELSSAYDTSESSIIDNISLDSLAFAEAVITDFTGHTPNEFTATESAVVQNISNIVGTDQNQPKLCSAERNPGIISALSDIVGTDLNQSELYNAEDNLGKIGAISAASENLFDKYLRPFDDFVKPEYDISQVRKATEYAVDNIYSWNQPEDHIGRTVPIFGPLIGTLSAKFNLLLMGLPVDDPTIQTSDITPGMLKHAAMIVMQEGNGNCGEHALVGAYLATRFPHFEQVAYVAKVGSGDNRHAFAIACEKDTKARTGWDLKELIHKTASDKLPAELYENNYCVYIDSWTPEPSVERITPDIVNKYKDVWENIVFDHIMKVDLSQRDNEMQSRAYQSEQSEKFLSIQQQVISPMQASSTSGTCSVNSGGGTTSCKPCLTDAEMAATVCKSFSIPISVGPFYDIGGVTAIWGWPDNIVIAAGGYNHLVGGYRIYRFDGTNWSESIAKMANGQNLPKYGIISDLWGTSPHDVYAVTLGAMTDPDYYYDYGGKILHYNGTGWSVVNGSPDPTRGSRSFSAIWGKDSSNIYAISLNGGVNPRVYHFDGVTWNYESLWRFGFEEYPQDVHGNASGDVYIIGFHDILVPAVTQYGPEWQSVFPLYEEHGGEGLWVSPDGHVFAVHYVDWEYDGSSFTKKIYITHFDGTSWGEMDITSLVSEFSSLELRKVWGRSNSDVYAVGVGSLPNDDGRTVTIEPVILHFNGKSWSRVQLPEDLSSFRPNGVWGSPTGDMFVGGYKGVLRIGK